MKVRRAWRRALAILLVAGAVGGGIRWWLGPVVPVVRTSRRDLVQTVVTSGRVETPARIALGSRVLGTILRVLVDEGDPVQAGQVVIELDDSEARATVAEARAALQEATARFGQVRTTGARLAGETLRQADVDLAQAEAELRRQESLAASGATSAARVDEARRALDRAGSRRDAAAIQAAGTAVSGGDRRIAAALVERAQASLALAEARLGQTRVSSPVAGIVLRRRAEPGDVVQPGEDLLDVARTGPTRLVVAPDEKSLALVRVGQRALASAEAFPDERFDAVVSFVAPSVDPERGTIEVRLDVPRAPANLRPDMTVSVEIEVARKRAALVLPTAALREPFSEAPWVLSIEGGRVRRRLVHVGVRGDAVVEVARGLRLGAPVVIGTVLPVEGQRVRARLTAPDGAAP